MLKLKKKLQRITNKRKIQKKKKKEKGQKNQTTSDNLVSRQVPFQLVSVLSILNDTQKQQLRDIGFGTMVDFNIKYLPMKLAKMLVQRLDAENCQMMVDGKLLRITKEDVRDILGFPMGNLQLKASKRAGMGKNKLALTWKRRYPTLPNGLQRIRLTDVKEMIEAQDEGGWNYKIDILVSIITVMCEGITCGTVNQRALGSINAEKDIRNMDWCSYVIDCLKRSKRKWKSDDPHSFYTGPLTFLMLWYAQKVSKQQKEAPAILHWTTHELKLIEAAEFSPKTNAEHPNTIVPLSIDYSDYVEYTGREEDIPGCSNNSNVNDGEDFVDQEPEEDDETSEKEFPMEAEYNKVNDPRVKRMVFCSGLRHAYDDVIGWNEKLFSTMRVGLDDFPDDPYFIEAVNDVKEKWLHYLEVLKQKLEHTFGDGKDGNVQMNDDEVDLTKDDSDLDEQNDAHNRDMNDNTDVVLPDEDVIENQYDTRRKVDEDDFTEHVDEDTVTPINVQQHSSSLTDSQVMKISEFVSQELKKKKNSEVFNENREESYSNLQTLAETVDEELICGNMEKDCAEKVKIRNEISFDVLSNEVCVDDGYKDLQEKEFTIPEELQKLLQSLPFLTVDREIDDFNRMKISSPEMLKFCIEGTKILNEFERKEELVINTSETMTEYSTLKLKDLESTVAIPENVDQPQTPVSRISTTEDIEPTPANFEKEDQPQKISSLGKKILNKLQLPKKKVPNVDLQVNEADVGKGKREKKPSNARKSPWNKRVVDIKTESSTEEMRLSNTIFCAASPV